MESRKMYTFFETAFGKTLFFSRHNPTLLELTETVKEEFPGSSLGGFEVGFNEHSLVVYRGTGEKRQRNFKTRVHLKFSRASGTLRDLLQKTGGHNGSKWSSYISFRMQKEYKELLSGKLDGSREPLLRVIIDFLGMSGEKGCNFLSFLKKILRCSPREVFKL